MQGKVEKDFMKIALQYLGLSPPPRDPCDERIVCRNAKDATDCATNVATCMNAKTGEAENGDVTENSCDRKKLCGEDTNSKSCDDKIDQCRTDLVAPKGVFVSSKSRQTPEYWFLLQNAEVLESTISDRWNNRSILIIDILKNTNTKLLIALSVIMGVVFFISIATFFFLIYQMWPDSTKKVKLFILAFLWMLVVAIYALLIKTRIL